jgi:hypothetical protein
MTYHVPLDICGKCSLLGCHLLRSALSKDALTSVVGLLKTLGRVKFRYGNKTNPFG